MHRWRELIKQSTLIDLPLTHHHLHSRFDNWSEIDLDNVRTHLAPFYSTTGWPSVDPELLIRMLIIGYCYGIRSERRLCEKVHL
jgi:transposase